MGQPGRTEIPVSSRRAAAHNDGGSTFIELLISVVLIGITGVAVLAAATAAVVGARTSDEVATSQASLAEAADYLTDLEPENVPYLSCVPPNNPLAAYQVALNTQFGAGSVEVVQVLLWDRVPEQFRHELQVQ